MRGFLVGSLWLLLYLFFCLVPLGLALGQPDAPGRTFLMDFSVALGFVGLSILALQFALVARFKVVAAPFGIDALLRFHKQISYVALVFVVAHPVLLFIADTEYLKLLNLWTAPWRARFAVTSVVLLLVLIALSVWRQRLRISYERWQATHGLIAVLVVLFALLHASLVGYYVTDVVRQVVYDGYIGILVFLLVWVRLISPFLRLRRPWRVVRVDVEPGNASTLVIEPVGHCGLPVRPGTVRLDSGRSLAVRDHPAPLLVLLQADPPPGGPVSLTIKAAGDFTRTIPDVAVGTRVYVDGPHGGLLDGSADRLRATSSSRGASESPRSTACC